MSLEKSDLEALSDMTADKILEKRRALWIDPESHYNDHAWIKTLRTEREERRKAWNKIIQSALLWALLVALAFLGKAVYNEVVHALLHK